MPLYYPSGTVLLGSSGTAFTTTLTNVSEVAGATLTLPALSANAILRLSLSGTHSASSANNKTWRVRLGGLGGSAVMAPAVQTTVTAFRLDGYIFGKNSVSSQQGQYWATRGTDALPTGGGNNTSVNWSTPQDLVISLQPASAAETMSLEFWLVELVKP